MEHERKRQTDKQTDRHDYYGNIIVHRAVKIKR